MSTLKTKNLQHPDSADALLLNATGGLSVPGALVSSVTGGGGSISGDRNRVINGSCQIVNVATFVASNNTSGFGGPEMFLVVNAGAGGQLTQSQGSLTFQGLSLPTVRQTVNTAATNISGANYFGGIEQPLEGFNVFDLRGKPVVISFVFNTNLSGTYAVALQTAGAGAQSYVSTFSAVANTPVQVSVAIPAIPLATTIANNNVAGLYITIGRLSTGAQSTATLNQWVNGNIFAATGATNWGATAGNFIELTRLQLEEGTVATPFVWRSYGQELALTQRYYEQSYELGVAPNTVTTNGAIHIGTVSAEGGGPSFHTLQFKVPKRTTPSLIFYNVNGGVGTWTYRRAGVANTAVSVSSVAAFSNSFSTLIQSGDIGAAYAAVILQGHFTANARL